MNGRINEKTFSLMLMDAMNYDFNLKTELQKIKCPIDLICGREDILTYIAYELKIAKPSISLYWIDKSGHFPMHEQPKEFYSILDQILEKVKNYR
jgi:pimeloyl-ACP methyl ester carboxylesterase